ncbi:unnamed protein product, partial [Amoebophrya sp. A25]
GNLLPGDLGHFDDLHPCDLCASSRITILTNTPPQSLRVEVPSLLDDHGSHIS